MMDTNRLTDSLQKTEFKTGVRVATLRFCKEDVQIQLEAWFLPYLMPITSRPNEKNMKIQILLLHLNGLLVNSHQHLLTFGMLERPPHFMAKNTTGFENGPYQGSWDFDFLGPQMLMSSGRGRFFDFVGVADEETSALLTPASTEESPITSTVKPFQPIVWLMVLISLLSVAIYFSVSSTLNLGRSDKNSRSLNMGDYVLYTAAILTNQGPVFWQPNYQSRISFRLTAGVWCLFALVMVNVYSSTLTAHITARKMSIPPRDSMVVMDQGVLAYLALDDGFGREFILFMAFLAHYVF
ncbi:hypothetical protein DAPPUDRAFT_244962 [Daphnia pulex]|uniref:Ionotropic glutamate receptor C-terminal domain-containing protein n=1 Tax=Daphnia pulex TaxID=6669 RepID=E9GMA0_DAPPU|nr:hypothetical protein DAPPUDRAFT_244962 [Daphnia pulex]|eukprot:EFX79426.1 hypothetical protein DAPPUDRAFT_244962 [Daphnia pulex]